MAQQQERWLGTAIFTSTFCLTGVAVGGMVTYGNKAPTSQVVVGCLVGGLVFTGIGLATGWFVFRRYAQPEPNEVARPWQPRFQLVTVLLLTFVISIAAAAGYYMVRALEASKVNKPFDGDRFDIFQFLAFTLIAPTMIMVVVSLLWRFLPIGRRRE